MHTIVFTGPSLKHSEAKQLLQTASQNDDALAQFDFRSPAAQGDVYKAALESPVAIAIIDGYFEVQPAIWHKEILWALKQGIYVTGASSLGALRAAELDTYGMRGVGWIYNAYASGEIDDDDEVALLHGPQEVSYQAVTDPMVNIRRTFSKALHNNVVDQTLHDELIVVAKSLFYKNRTYKNIFCEYENNASFVRAAQINQLADWIKQNKVDQKKADAITLLEHLARSRTKPTGTWPRKEAFSHTYYWELMRTSADSVFPTLSDSSC